MASLVMILVDHVRSIDKWELFHRDSAPSSGLVQGPGYVLIH